MQEAHEHLDALSVHVDRGIRELVRLQRRQVGAHVSPAQRFWLVDLSFDEEAVEPACGTPVEL